MASPRTARPAASRDARQAAAARPNDELDGFRRLQTILRKKSLGQPGNFRGFLQLNRRGRSRPPSVARERAARFGCTDRQIANQIASGLLPKKREETTRRTDAGWRRRRRLRPRSDTDVSRFRSCLVCPPLHEHASQDRARLSAPPPCDDAETWRRLFLKHGESLLAGATAPDDNVQGFSQSRASTCARSAGAEPSNRRRPGTSTPSTRSTTNNGAKPRTPPACLSHYYADPLMPLHTAHDRRGGHRPPRLRAQRLPFVRPF